MVVVAKVLPIQQLIKQTQRRKDDYEWEGDFEKALLEGEYLKELKDDEAKGVTWYPNFQVQHCHQHLHQHTLLVSFIYGIYMQEETEDGENPNTPFDDVTHWVGNLPSKDNDSTERSSKRDTRRKTKSNFLRKKLGVETKRKD